MFVSSIVYYYFIKKVQNLGVGRVYVVFNYIVPTLLYMVIIGLTGSFFESWKVILTALFVSVFFSYTSAIISYVAIEKSPNAGYSLIIQKSYAVYTTIVSIFVFSAEVNYIKIAAIVLILLAIAVITLDKKENSKISPNSKWIILSLISLLLFGGISLGAKLAVSKFDAQPTVYLFYSIFFTTIIALVDAFKNRKVELLSLTKKQILMLILMGIAVSSFYFFKNLSDVSAPNIGYSNVINASSNAAFTVFTAFIFKDHLSWRKMIGVIGVVIGLVILFL